MLICSPQRHLPSKLRDCSPLSSETPPHRSKLRHPTPVTSISARASVAAGCLISFSFTKRDSLTSTSLWSLGRLFITYNNYNNNRFHFVCWMRIAQQWQNALCYRCLPTQTSKNILSGSLNCHLPLTHRSRFTMLLIYLENYLWKVIITIFNYFDALIFVHMNVLAACM